MNKEEIFELIFSWENLELLMKEVIDSGDTYLNLMEMALYDERAMTWRAAYLIDKINDLQPELILPYLEKMIEQVQVEKHGGKRRHFLKLISMNKIPEQKLGLMLDFAIETFKSSKEAVAVRVHAMQILYNITELEPELKHEILTVIEHEMENHSSAGIISRGKKLVKKLKSAQL